MPQRAAKLRTREDLDWLDGVVARPLRRRSLRRLLRQLLGEEEHTGATDDTSALEGARVLVVEDDPVSQKLLRRMLEGAGVAVRVVGDGRAAVEACTSEDYDVVLMDRQLPELDGFAATRAIREDERSSGRERVPILSMSADLARGDHAALAEAGLDGHLGKPVARAALLDVVARWRRVPAGTAD